MRDKRSEFELETVSPRHIQRQIKPAASSAHPPFAQTLPDDFMNAALEFLLS
jgi:hypothetical protein